jgi:uncharacterized protein (DUF58 family)
MSQSTTTSTQRAQGQRSPRSWFIDPAAIMQIQNLTLRAKTVVEGFTSGLHRSPLRGFSVEFAEYRPYVLGDDLRNLDWKLVARSDRYYVKQFEDETNRRCYLAIDQSKSMNYSTAAYTKAEYARTLAATLAYFLYGQRDAVGLITCGTAEPDYLPARHRTGHLQQIMSILGKDNVGVESDLTASLSQLAGLSKRRGLVVLLSDLLLPVESLQQPLGYLRGRGHEVLVLRVLDRSELDLSLPHAAMLRDLETGKEIYVDPEATRAEYRRRFDDHLSQLTELCHRKSARLSTVVTDQPLDNALFELLHSLGRG